MKCSLKKLAEKVFIDNMVAMYSDINKKNTKVASAPRVGIFWIDVETNKIYSDSVGLRDAEDYGDYKIGKTVHYDAWKKIKPQNPKWSGKQYEDVPRGRVIYKKDPKKPMFVVFMCDECKNKKIENAVMGEFSIPSGHVKFDYTDEHYMIASFE